MDHHELLDRLADKFDERCDRLEAKLDRYSEVSSKNTADLRWVKGYIKLSLTAILGIITSAIAGVLKYFSNN